MWGRGLPFTRGVRGWLEARYLPKTGMDVGVRTSLATGASYAGVIIAILLTFAYVASARSAYRVKSELLFQIVPDMRAKGIALASSTPVVNIGLPDHLIEPETGQPT